MAPDSPPRRDKEELQDLAGQLDAKQPLEVDERLQNGTASAGEKNATTEVKSVKSVRKEDDDGIVNNNNHGSKKHDGNSHHQDSRRERDRSRRRSVTLEGKLKRSASPGKGKVSPSSRKRPTTPLRKRWPSPGDRKRKHRGRSSSLSSSGRSRSRSRSRTRSRSRSRSSSPSRSPRSGRALSPHSRDHRERSRSRSPPGGHRRSPRGRDYSAGKRYSPRRRNSPRIRGRRGRSPLRRRPWSPPTNRSNGVGKPGNNLFIAGFNFITTERDLERKFSRYGRVMDVRIVRDKRSGESRGFGFLTLERDEDADAAIKALDQTEWNGRIVLVEKAKTPTRF